MGIYVKWKLFNTLGIVSSGTLFKDARVSRSLSLSLSLCAHARGDDFNEIGVNNVIIKT